MPEQIRCPDCAAVLRVPDNLLGSLVKCPKCQTTFTAEVSPPEPIRPQPEEPPPRRSLARDDEADDDDETEEEYRPRRRRRRRRISATAESAVTGPAISLMVTAGLSIAGGLVDLVFRVVNLAGGIDEPGFAGSTSPEYTAGAIFGGCFDLVGMLVAVVMIVGALKMKNLQSHGLALTSCILAMLPLHCCCILGLPFGIWGVVVLNNPEVKDAFS
jgi:predicted Zn finger-like uncharacterized protein